MSDNDKYRFILKQLWQSQTNSFSAGIAETEGISIDELYKDILSAVINKIGSMDSASIRYEWAKNH